MLGVVDIAVVGAGPAGMTAAIYGARARAKTVVFEQALPGGQIAIASWVENYPGFAKGISGQELAELMHQQALSAGAEFCSFAPVQAVRRGTQGFVLTVDGKEVEARIVILATGAIPRKLGIPGEAKFTGRGVSWCATCDGPLYEDKTVAVVGGGDSATQEALYLARIAKEVHLVHRRAELRATKCLQEECFLHRHIAMHLSQIVSEIIGENGNVAALRLRSKLDGSENVLPVDGVFEFIGVDAQSKLVAELCVLDEASFVKVDPNGLSSCPGLYAAGDVTDHELKQAVTASARGALCAFHAARWLEGA
jgi:thioredoxin reductase (NADPH)